MSFLQFQDPLWPTSTLPLLSSPLSRCSLPFQLSTPYYCLLEKFQSLLYVLLPTPLIMLQKTPHKDPRNYLITLLQTPQTRCFRKPSSTVELLLPSDHRWQQQPFVFYRFLEIGAACPEPAAATQLVAPARQDTDAQGPGQCTPKCNNSLLFSTLPCWDSTLNSEELAHPKIQKKSLFVRVNMGHDCYRKQRCYHSYARSWRCPVKQLLLEYHFQNLNTIHYYCSMYCTEQ